MWLVTSDKFFRASIIGCAPYSVWYFTSHDTSQGAYHALSPENLKLALSIFSMFIVETIKRILACETYRILFGVAHLFCRTPSAYSLDKMHPGISANMYALSLYANEPCNLYFLYSGCYQLTSHQMKMQMQMLLLLSLVTGWNKVKWFKQKLMSCWLVTSWMQSFVLQVDGLVVMQKAKVSYIPLTKGIINWDARFHISSLSNVLGLTSLAVAAETRPN